MEGRHDLGGAFDVQASMAALCWRFFEDFRDCLSCDDHSHPHDRTNHCKKMEGQKHRRKNDERRLKPGHQRALVSSL
jgi:hypothetical protein